MKYRKKPVVIDAYQFFPGMLDTPGVRLIPAHAVDMTGKYGSKNRGIIHEAPDRWVIDTLEGVMELRAGDWVITGVKGEKYPCKPDIFDLTYEPVDGQEVVLSFDPESDIGRARKMQFLPLEFKMKHTPPVDRLNPVRMALSLLDVMVRTGEKHTEQSINAIKEAWLILGKGN